MTLNNKEKLENQITEIITLAAYLADLKSLIYAEDWRRDKAWVDDDVRIKLRGKAQEIIKELNKITKENGNNN